MPKLNIFLDSSALISGVISPIGAARALLLLAEADRITITISEQVISETERILAAKKPKALVLYRTAVRYADVHIIPDPSQADIESHANIISDTTDVPIVVAAMNAQADYLVTFNRRHFIDDPGVAIKSGLRIGSAGDALAWIRVRLV